MLSSPPLDADIFHNNVLESEMQHAVVLVPANVITGVLRAARVAGDMILRLEVGANTAKRKFSVCRDRRLGADDFSENHNKQAPNPALTSVCLCATGDEVREEFSRVEDKNGVDKNSLISGCK